MLLHLRPRIYTELPHASIVDFDIPELNLGLKRGIDLATRQPYPNTGYKVACRNVGKKAIDGILVDVDAIPSTFTSVARWVVNAERIVTHIVHYTVLDTDFDTVSDDTTMLYGTSASLGGWESRWPGGVVRTPVRNEPCMLTKLPGPGPEGETAMDSNGFITQLKQAISLPTVQRDRVLNHWEFGVPAIEHAFVAS